jgi:hypothetical protein
MKSMVGCTNKMSAAGLLTAGGIIQVTLSSCCVVRSQLIIAAICMLLNV